MAQKKIAMEAKAKVEEEASRVRSDLFEAREKIKQLEDYLAVEHGIAKLWQLKIANLEKALELGLKQSEPLRRRSNW